MSKQQTEVAAAGGTDFSGFGGLKAVLEGDPKLSGAMMERLVAERDAAQEAVNSATQRLEAINEMIAQFGGEGTASAPTRRANTKATAPSGGERPQASKNDVLKALTEAGAKGMTLGALRSAVGNKRTGEAIEALGDRVQIPTNQKSRGAGLVVRLAK